MSGPPYYLSPHTLLKSWTLPQTLFIWVRRQEDLAAEAAQAFSMRMAAIGAVFAKDGHKIARRILDSLDGPGMTIDDWKENLDETQKLILFGKQDEHETNPDTHKNNT